MDPRLVVSFLDLAREADISSLVLRFGGECELIQFNDKNALAVFHDPARAATAVRKLDHASTYHGASVVLMNGGNSVSSTATNTWGTGGTSKEKAGVAAVKSNPWKQAEYSWREDSWGGEEWTGGSLDVQVSAWKQKDSPIKSSVNCWTALESETAYSSSLPSTRLDVPGKRTVQSSLGQEVNGVKSHSAGQQKGVQSETELPEAAEDWEEFDSDKMQQL